MKKLLLFFYVCLLFSNSEIFPHKSLWNIWDNPSNEWSISSPNRSDQISVIKNFLNKTVFGDSVLVIHSAGTGEGNVYVVVDDPTLVTGHDYEVFFDKQMYYRNEDGEWIPIPPGRVAAGQNNPDTLTGSTV